MATNHLKRENQRKKNRPGIASVKARKVAKRTMLLFFIIVIAGLTMMYMGYGVPGRAWILPDLE